jgi:uncharacterized protein (TIGR02246 family)
MKKRSVYCIELLKQWNKRRASEITDLFTEAGNLVGSHESQINGRSEARSVLSKIFADHQTAAYLGTVKEVRLLCPDVAILRAVAGMVPPGQSDINPRGQCSSDTRFCQAAE